MLKLTCWERFVLRQSRLHSGLAQVFLALFALLAVLAPTFDAPLPGNEFEEYVSAPADPRSDAAVTVSATLGVAEDFEEEADQEEPGQEDATFRSEEHTSELQSLMRISYAVFC